MSLENDGEFPGDGCPAEGAGQNADECDANLNRRQKLIGIIGQFQSGAGFGIALFGPLLQAGLTG